MPTCAGESSCDDTYTKWSWISILLEGINRVTFQQQSSPKRTSEASVWYQRPQPQGQPDRGTAMRGPSSQTRRRSSPHPERSSHTLDSRHPAPLCAERD